MAAVMADVSAVAKDQRNQAQGFNFRGIDNVYNALHPIFAAHGIICLPSCEKIETSDYLNAKGNKVFRTLVTMGYIFMASDGSMTPKIIVPGEGMDHGDKSCAKALSVAHKYCLIQVFTIPTAELIDGDYDPTIEPRSEIERLRELNAQLLDEDRKKLAAQGIDPALAEPMTFTRPAAVAQPPEEDNIPMGDEKPAGAPPKEPATPPKKEPKPPKAAKETPATPEWMNYAIQHVDKYKGKLLSELAGKDIETLYSSWVIKYADKIKANSDKAEEARIVTLAHKALFPEKHK